MAKLPYFFEFEQHLIALGFDLAMRTNGDSQRAYRLDLAGGVPLSDRIVNQEPLFDLARARFGNGLFQIVLAHCKLNGRTPFEGWAVEFAALSALIQGMGCPYQKLSEEVWHFMLPRGEPINLDRFGPWKGHLWTPLLQQEPFDDWVDLVFGTPD